MKNSGTTRIHITLPDEFLATIDMAAMDHMMTRSQFIRIALMEKMNTKQMFTPHTWGQPSEQSPANVEDPPKEHWLY